jgi:two-component system chemotaxis sensor kinase CheA
MLDDIQKKLLPEFSIESHELLNHIERILLELETDPGKKGLIGDVFRHMHTLKGNCLMFGFDRLEELTHSAENVLDLLRDGSITVDREVGTLLLGVVDSVRGVLKTIEKSGEEGDADFGTQLDKLRRVRTAAAPALNLLESGADDDGRAPAGGGIDNKAPLAGDDSSTGLETVHLPITRLDGLMNIIGTMVVTYNQLRYSLYSRLDASGIRTIG